MEVFAQAGSVHACRQMSVGHAGCMHACMHVRARVCVHGHTIKRQVQREGQASWPSPRYEDRDLASRGHPSDSDAL